MKRIEVVTHDLSQAKSPVVDHVWKVARHHGKRKMRKLMRRVNRWARKAAGYDKSTDHVVYTREI